LLSKFQQKYLEHVLQSTLSAKENIPVLSLTQKLEELFTENKFHLDFLFKKKTQKVCHSRH